MVVWCREGWMFFLIAFAISPSEWRWDFPWQKKSLTLRIVCSLSETLPAIKMFFFLKVFMLRILLALLCHRRVLSKGVKWKQISLSARKPCLDALFELNSEELRQLCFWMRDCTLGINTFLLMHFYFACLVNSA